MNIFECSCADHFLTRFFVLTTPAHQSQYKDATTFVLKQEQKLVIVKKNLALKYKKVIVEVDFRSAFRFDL
jgi:hypothetical protein